MKSSLRRAAAVALAAVMCLPVLSGCKDKAAGTKDGKTVIKVANWPAESSTNYESMEQNRKEFMEKYPDIYDRWSYAIEIVGENFFYALACGIVIHNLYNLCEFFIKKLIDKIVSKEVEE